MWQAIIATLSNYNIEYFFKLIEIKLLRYNTNTLLGLGKMRINIMSKDTHVTGCFRDQRANNANSGRFTRTIWPE